MLQIEGVFDEINCPISSEKISLNVTRFNLISGTIDKIRRKNKLVLPSGIVRYGAKWDSNQASVEGIKVPRKTHINTFISVYKQLNPTQLIKLRLAHNSVLVHEVEKVETLLVHSSI